MPAQNFDETYLQLLHERQWEAAQHQVQQGGYALSPDTATPDRILPVVETTAKRYNLDPTLVDAVIATESNYNARAVSPKGAQGLMQLMPATARQYGVHDPFDPEQNIVGGTRYLEALHKRYGGDLAKVLAAYNAGPGAVDKHGGVPPYPETQAYVQRVFAAMDQLAMQARPGPQEVPEDWSPARLTSHRPARPRPTRMEQQRLYAQPGAAEQQARQAHGMPPSALAPSQRIQPQLVAEQSAEELRLRREEGLPLPRAYQEPGLQEAFPTAQIGTVTAPIRRVGGDVGAGALGAFRSLLATPEAFGLIGDDSPTAGALQGARQALAQVEQAIAPEDPTFLDHVFRAAGTMAFSYLPGLAAGTIVARGAALMGAWARAAQWAPSVVAAALESAQEMGEVYDAVKTLLGPEQAVEQVREVFGKNMLLLTLTNQLGILSPLGRGLPKLLTGALMEGVQEGMQYDYSRRAFWVPATHARAEDLKALGWVARDGRLEQPFQFQDAAMAAAVGAILGGTAAVVTGEALAQDQASLPAPLREAAAAAEQEAEQALPQTAVREGYGTETPGPLKRVYHGTQEAFQQFDPGKGHMTQYGTGTLWFAENPEVAGGPGRDVFDLGYATPTPAASEGMDDQDARAMQLEDDITLLLRVQADHQAIATTLQALQEASVGTEAQQEMIATLEADERRLTALLGPAPTAATIDAMVRALTQELDTVSADIQAREAATKAEGPQWEGTPNVHAVFLDIRHPFDTSRPLSQEDTARLEEALATMPGLTPDEREQLDDTAIRSSNPARAVFEAVAKTLGSSNRARTLLRHAGFDGIFHVSPHDGRVWVAFSPEQVTPAFSLMDNLLRGEGFAMEGNQLPGEVAGGRTPRPYHLPTVQGEFNTRSQAEIPGLSVLRSGYMRDPGGNGWAVFVQHSNGTGNWSIQPTEEGAKQYIADHKQFGDVLPLEDAPAFLFPDDIDTRQVRGAEAFGRLPYEGAVQVGTEPSQYPLPSGYSLPYNSQAQWSGITGEEMVQEDGEAQPSPEQLGLGGVPQQTTFTLPHALAGAQVNAGQVPLTFTSDLDKALYILGNPKAQSAQHGAYLQEVMDFWGVPEGEAMRRAEARRDAIVKYVRQHGQAGQPLVIPPAAVTGAEMTLPGVQAPLGEAVAGPLVDQAAQEARSLPVIDESTMIGLRQFLRMMNEEQRATLVIDGKPREINYRYIETDEGVKQTLAAISEDWVDLIDQIRAPKNWETVKAMAEADSMTIGEFLALPQDELVSRVKAYKARDWAVAGARQLRVATAMFRSGTMAGRDLLRVFALQTAIQLQFARLANEAGGALQIFQAPVEGDIANLKGFQQMMEYLGSQRISDEKLATLIEQTPTPEQLSLIIGQASTTMAKDVFLPIWYGLWLLSNPTTLEVNFLSTMAAIPFGIAERAIAARVPGKTIAYNTAAARALLAADPNLTAEQRKQLRVDASALYQRDVYPGEAQAMLYALWRTSGDAWRLTKKAFVTGESAFTEKQTAEGMEQAAKRGFHRMSEDVRGIRYVGYLPVGGVAKAVTAGPLHWAWDALGAVAQTVSGGMFMADEFGRALNFQMEAYALSYRHGMETGIGEGRSVSDVLAAMADWRAKIPPEALDVIKAGMEERVFQRNVSELGLIGKIGQGLMNAKAEHPILNLFVPFIRTPANITNYNLERFPLTAIAMHGIHADLAAGGARRDLAIAKMTMGTLTAMTFALLGQMGLGVIRGEGDPNKTLRRLEEDALRKQPYSLVIPFRGEQLTVSYRRLDPWAQQAGFWADWGRRAQDVYASNATQEWMEIGVAGLHALAKNIFNRNYMQGFQDFMELVFNDEDQDPETTLSKYNRFAQDQFRRFVPAGVGALESALDPAMTEVETEWEALKSRLPWGEKTPRLTFFADPVERPHMTPLVDIFNPFPVSVTQDDPIARELVAQRANVGGAARFLLMPRRPQLGPEDEGIQLTPEEFNRHKTLFAKEATNYRGETLREALERLIYDPAYQEKLGGPNSGKTKALNEVIADFKELGRKAFLEEAEDTRSPQAGIHRTYHYAKTRREARETTPSRAQRLLDKAGVGGVSP